VTHIELCKIKADMAIQRETVRALGDFFWRSQAREVGAYDQVDERSVIKRSLRNPEMAVRARSIPAKMIGGQASQSLTELGSWMKTDESRRRLGFGWATPFLDGCKPKCTVPDGRLRIREVMMGCCSPILSSLDLSMTDRGWEVVVVTLSLPLPSITRARANEASNGSLFRDVQPSPSPRIHSTTSILVAERPKRVARKRIKTINSSTAKMLG